MPGHIEFLRLPISLPCPVPVLPGTPETMVSGEPIPLEQRTEACAIDAFWMIGSQVTCDVHLRAACGVLGLDADEIFEGLGGPADVETGRWANRRRYPQEMAKQGAPWV